jgi:hypothetical protein
MKTALPRFLPGRFMLRVGRVSDYARLERFHYLPKRPRTWVSVWVVRYVEGIGSSKSPPRGFGGARRPGRIVAIGVLSYPFIGSFPRERLFGLSGASYRRKARFVNKNIRTISRVIVHPQFRSLGLATLLVRCLCDHCPTRYVEASAAMGRVHPFFERAGMTRHEPVEGEGPIYFLLDREG